jgi:hypothetical protein
MINSNNSEYSIATDNEVSAIISHFNDDYIYTTVNKSIDEKIRAYNMQMPNIVVSYEQYFKQAIDQYPDASSAIYAARDNVYSQIIKILCNYYQLVFNDNDIQDLYSSAVYLYEFLVSNFQNNLIEFFSNYILKEKNAIYDVLNLGTLKRNKDSSTIYSKKIYKNTRLGIICANLDVVIDNINVFDIDYAAYLNTVYNNDNRNIAKHIEMVTSPLNDFFKTYISSCFLSNMRPVLITSIRLKLQELSSFEGNLNKNDIIKEEEPNNEQ